ncbi:cytochrome c oxidase subunit 5B, mitochondrial [Tyto alba]|uniref:cytochrome c oxidase subunit 5B, mitochondrial n=1 Tax=Tyto alba TaxID=56313 RepID=UPI001C6718BC|nr:cytochrome c oxidase subunit 5B, mitochondrial [Tyto alba]
MRAWLGFPLPPPPPEALVAAMASRLLRVSAALRLLPGASVRRFAGPGSLASDEEQATGLERKVMEAMNKGLDPYSMFRPKRYAGTKEDPNLVPSITNKRIVGCVCEEDNSCVIWFWLHEGEAQRCPSCGTHYKLIPHELPH